MTNRIVIYMLLLNIIFFVPACTKKVKIQGEEALPGVEGMISPEEKEVVGVPEEERDTDISKDVESDALNPSKIIINFGFDRFNLTPEARKKLNMIASWLEKEPGAKLLIEGHTCDIGTNEYNLALGERRANSAKKYLVNMGVSKKRLSTISYGEEKPLDPGYTEEDRTKNRRCQFVIK